MTKLLQEALKEQHSLADLAQKYEIRPTRISAWKRDLLDEAEQVFESRKKDARSETDREKYKLLKAIGQLYAIDRFFIELELCPLQGSILNMGVFVHGKKMDKYTDTGYQDILGFL